MKSYKICFFVLLSILMCGGRGAFAAFETIYHDVHRSLVFDAAGDLAVAANDLAVSRFIERSR